jgi:hypothetical protein
MPLRNGKPLTIRPTTVCDSQDLTNGPDGGMLSLVNLIPAPTTDKVWVPRPAAQVKSIFVGITGAGFGSGELIVGNIAYGMIASSLNPGFDQPFAVDLTTGSPLPVAGITANNVPVSPPTTGDWVPPILAKVGTRIVVTHPGFGGTFSGFVRGATVEGSAMVSAGATIAGAQPGNAISGPGIAGGTTILQTSEFFLTVSADTNSNNVLTAVVSAAEIFPGMVVFDATGSIPADTFVVSVDPVGQTVSLNHFASSSASGLTLLFGGTNIVLSQPATATVAVPLSQLFVSGQSGVLFGWFDISSFVVVTTGTIYPNSDLITGNPSIVGVQPGMMISASALPPGTTVVSVSNLVNDTVADQNGTMFLANVGNISPLYPGMNVAGEGIPSGTTVTGVLDSTAILSQAATLTQTGVPVTFSGASITVSQLGMFFSTPAALTITGGTPDAPLWGAGNTQINPLVAKPVSVAQMAGSAFYAVGNAVVISDPLEACQVTNASQALTFDLPVTALGSLPLNSLLGGIVQAIIAFQGVASMQQITGAFATSNLAVNQLPIETGTLSPLSIVPTSKGLAFISPQGLRFINFSCQVSDPVGDHGQGVASVFIFCPTPSRICAAAQSDTLRISVINAAATGSPTQEYWWDFSRKTWSGPHTFPASLIQPWMNTFIMFPAGVLGQLWQSDATQNSNPSFVENGKQLGYYYATSLLPDTGAMAENAIVETTVMIALPAGQQISIGFNSDEEGILDSQILFGISSPVALYGQGAWGQGFWGGGGGPILVQRQVPWAVPLVFKQGWLTMSGLCQPGVMLGNANLRYQILGYLLERAS